MLKWPGPGQAVRANPPESNVDDNSRKTMSPEYDLTPRGRNKSTISVVKAGEATVAIGVPQKPKDVKMSMTLEEATLIIQSRWRGISVRRHHLNLGARLHLGYEIRILEYRERRRSLVDGFMQHLTFMALLIGVFMLQHGSTVPARYALVETLKDYVNGVESPSGVTFDSAGSIPEVWEWTETFAEGLVPSDGGRVFLKTYNQLVGSIRLEATRVTSDSCAYKESAWIDYLMEWRRPMLQASEARDCKSNPRPAARPLSPPKIGTGLQRAESVCGCISCRRDYRLAMEMACQRLPEQR
jgi:hypothetical protein